MADETFVEGLPTEPHRAFYVKSYVPILLCGKKKDKEIHRFIKPVHKGMKELDHNPQKEKPQNSNVFFPGKGGYLHLVPEYEAKTPPALAGPGPPGNGL